MLRVISVTLLISALFLTTVQDSQAAFGDDQAFKYENHNFSLDNSNESFKVPAPLDFVPGGTDSPWLAWTYYAKTLCVLPHQGFDHTYICFRVGMNDLKGKRWKEYHCVPLKSLNPHGGKTCIDIHEYLKSVLKNDSGFYEGLYGVSIDSGEGPVEGVVHVANK